MPAFSVVVNAFTDALVMSATDAVWPCRGGCDGPRTQTCMRLEITARAKGTEAGRVCESPLLSVQHTYPHSLHVQIKGVCVSLTCVLPITSKQLTTQDVMMTGRALRTSLQVKPLVMGCKVCARCHAIQGYCGAPEDKRGLGMKDVPIIAQSMKAVCQSMELGYLSTQCF